MGKRANGGATAPAQAGRGRRRRRVAGSAGRGSEASPPRRFSLSGSVDDAEGDPPGTDTEFSPAGRTGRPARHPLLVTIPRTLAARGSSPGVVGHSPPRPSGRLFATVRLRTE